MLPPDIDPRHRFALLVLLPYGPLHPLLQPRLIATSPTRRAAEVLRDQLRLLETTSALQFRGVDGHYQLLPVPRGETLLQILDLERARLLFRDWQKAYGELVQREDAAASPAP